MRGRVTGDFPALYMSYYGLERSGYNRLIARMSFAVSISKEGQLRH